MATFTSNTVSIDIHDGIATAGQPAEPIEAGVCFWDTSIPEMYLALMSVQAGYRCIAGGTIKDYSPANPDIVKAWTLREIQQWLNGLMLTVAYDYTATVYTLTISGDDWTGTDADETEALGKAFVNLLNDVNFNDYVA